MSAYVSAMPHLHDWAPSQISDRRFAVTAFRAGAYHLDGELIPAGREFRLGESQYPASGPITAIEFYTGFPGCPARYYVTTTREDGREQTTIHTVY